MLSHFQTPGFALLDLHGLFSNQEWLGLLGCLGFPLTLAKAVRHFPILPFQALSVLLVFELGRKPQGEPWSHGCCGWSAGRTRQAEETRRGHSSVCQPPTGVPGAAWGWRRRPQRVYGWGLRWGQGQVTKWWSAIGCLTDKTNWMRPFVAI